MDSLGFLSPTEAYPAGLNFSSELEDVFLGCCINHPEVITQFHSLPPCVFFQPAARAIWALVISGCDDFPNLLIKLSEKHHAYLQSIMSQFGISTRLAAWAKQLVDLYSQREIYRVVNEAISFSRSKSMPPQTAIEQIVANLNAISALATTDETLEAHSSASEGLLKSLSAASEAEDNKVPSWGWADLDHLTGGLQRGHLITIGARSSMGKSTFALNAAENVAKAGHPTLFITLEMSKEELETKIFSRNARVNGNDFRDARSMSERTYDRLISYAIQSAEMPLYLDDGGYCSASDVEATILKVQNCHSQWIEVVFIDYIQLMSLDSGGASNMVAAVSKLTRELKSLARKLGIAIVILSQLNRGVESKQDKRPMMSDLRDSGSIEQDSNLVLMLYRDAYYNPHTELGNTTEVLVVKNRSGACGKVELVFDGRYSDFAGKLSRG